MNIVCETEPVEHGLPGHGWTLKKLQHWLKQVMGCDLARSTLHRILLAAQLRWKKCQKVFKKADTQQRADFMARFHKLYAQLHRQKIRLVYVDEAHIHRDMDLGYTWTRKNQIAWRMSDSAPFSDRINWYGAYDFGAGQCFIWNEGSCNKEHTIQFLQRMAEWLGDGPGAVIIIWDGATWHRAKAVQIAAVKLGLILFPLPAYSPDLNPIENLWRWMREEVTHNHGHPSMRHLFDACKAFINRINAHPERVVSRLWPKFELNPEYEKLLVSN